MMPSEIPRIGCVYRPQFGPERLAAAARAADTGGLDELWLWEDCFLTGGISAAAIALSHSRDLTVGIGLMPAPMRNVALMAMEISTLARAFPGRIRVGVGHGAQNWMEQIGARVASPLTLLREYLICLGALLRGERVSFHGRYLNLEAVALEWPPTHEVEILAGAMGPKSLQLSGALADGTIITGSTSADELTSALAHVRVGEAAGTHTGRHSVVTYVPCTTGPDASRDLAQELRFLGYDTNSGLGVSGEALEIAVGVQRWLNAGASTIVLQPTAHVDIVEFVRFVGSEVSVALRPRTSH